MKLPTAIASTALLVSCGSSTPLTESECRTMTDKEASYMASLIDDYPSLEQSRVATELPDSFKRIAEMGITQCVAGKSFNRSDYECVVTANSKTEVGECLTSAHERS